MITAEDLRAYVGAPASADSILESIEAGAVAFIEGQTGWRFGDPAETTLVLSGTGSATLWLSQPPSNVESVSYRDSLNSVWIEIAAENYEVDGRKLFRLGDVWPKGSRNIQVVATVGFDPGDEPADIRQLVYDLVAMKWSSHGKESIRSESASLGKLSISTSYAPILLKDVPGAGATLARYTNTVWG